MSEKENIVEVSDLHFLLLVSVLFSHSLNFVELERILLYLNTATVLFYAILNRKANGLLRSKPLICSPLLPLSFFFLHIVALGEIQASKDLRTMILTVFFSLGLWINSIVTSRSKSLYYHTAITFLLAFILVQGVSIILFSKEYGTTTNPHYLAQSCVLLIPLTIYLCGISSKKMKYLLVPSAIGLTAMLLHTSSRPAWIGLLLVAGLFVLHQERKKRFATIGIIVAALGGLYLTDYGNFGSRVHELLANIGTEERVSIWRDSLRMQNTGTPRQWVFGHGLNTFRPDFKAYSEYHTQGIDFNSPHNFLIELLYTSGVLGLFVVVAFVTGIYRTLIRRYFDNNRSSFELMLIAALTANLSLVSITLPFFTSYNLIVIGLICGILLSERKLDTESLRKL